MNRIKKSEANKCTVLHTKQQLHGWTRVRNECICIDLTLQKKKGKNPPLNSDYNESELASWI